MSLERQYQTNKQLYSDYSCLSVPGEYFILEEIINLSSCLHIKQGNVMRRIKNGKNIYRKGLKKRQKPCLLLPPIMR